MSGTWDLQVDKSHWGQKAKPVQGEIVIEHTEPSYSYKGKVTESSREGDTRAYEFKGAIDGSSRDAGTGAMTLKRIDDSTISSEFKSTDGTIIESGISTISSDGRTLSRRVTRKGPEGTASWTEVYVRRN